MSGVPTVDRGGPGRSRFKLVTVWIWASDGVATPAPVTSMGGPDGDEEGSSRRREGEMLLLIFFLTIICGMCVFCMVLLLVKWQ